MSSIINVYVINTNIYVPIINVFIIIINHYHHYLYINTWKRHF